MPNELKVFFLELWDGAQELLLRNVTQAKRARFELDRLESGKRLIIKIYSANKKGKYAGGDIWESKRVIIIHCSKTWNLEGKYFSPSIILLFLTWQVVRCRGRLDGVCPPEL